MLAHVALLQQLSLPRLQRFLFFRIAVAVLVGDREFIVPVIEILQRGVKLHLLRQRLVALVRDRNRLRGLLRLLPRFFDLRIFRTHAIFADAVDADVDRVGGIKPAAPEPVQVGAGSVFHGAEKVGRSRALELPAQGVLLEGEIEQFAPEDGLAQDVERRGRLVVGIRRELQQGLGIGHDGHLVLAAHVVDDLARLAIPGREMLFPRLLGQVLQEGIEAFVHPRPLALVRVDDHGEVIVSHFVDDHADQVIFRRLRIREFTRLLVLHGTPAIERNHRILHAAHGAIDGNRVRIRIVETVLVVLLDRVHDGARAVLLPQRVALIRIVRHGHHALAAAVEPLRIPDELAARRPRHVAHIGRLEVPGFHPRRAALFRRQRFGGRDHQQRRIAVFRPRQALALHRAQHAGRILQLARGGHHMVARHRQIQLVVAKFQREFAGAEELLVLPANGVVIRGHARKPLCDLENRVLVVFKIFIAGALDQHLLVID